MVAAADLQVETVEHLHLAVAGKAATQADERVGAVVRGALLGPQFLDTHPEQPIRPLERGPDLGPHRGRFSLHDHPTVAERGQVGAPGRDVRLVADEQHEREPPAGQPGEHPVEFDAGRLVEPLPRVFDHQQGDAAGQLGEQQELARLAGTQLAVALVQVRPEPEQVDERTVLLHPGEEGAGRGARIEPVEEVGVVAAQFRLVQFLLAAEGDHPEIRGQLQPAGGVRGLVAAEEVAEPLHPRTGRAHAAPGLAGPDGEAVDPQAGCAQPLDLDHGPVPCTSWPCGQEGVLIGSPRPARTSRLRSSINRATSPGSARV